MDFSSSEFGIPGERDDDGYLGYYPFGTQFLLVDGPDVLVALRFKGCPEEVLLVARRHRGQEVPLSPQPDAFLGVALRKLLLQEGVKQIKVLPGVAAPVKVAEP